MITRVFEPSTSSLGVLQVEGGRAETRGRSWEEQRNSWGSSVAPTVDSLLVAFLTTPIIQTPGIRDASFRNSFHPSQKCATDTFPWVVVAASRRIRPFLVTQRKGRLDQEISTRMGRFELYAYALRLALTRTAVLYYFEENRGV